MIAIEPAVPGDVQHVRKIAGEVFEEYGDYAKILPRFFAAPGVATTMARQEGKVLGFLMMGFLPWNGAGEERWVGDVLAIAVLPGHQRQGIGSALMKHAMDLAAQMSEWREVREVQLTCAESNEAGLKFFAKQGFRVIDTAHGCYSGGQMAWRLARPYKFQAKSLLSKIGQVSPAVCS